jgi:hypothetical protein
MRYEPGVECKKINNIWITLWFGHRELILFILVIATHAIVGIYYKEVIGLDIEANPLQRPWDWWWQTVSVDLLRNDLWRSIWFLHSQPPIFNFYGAFFFNFFPDMPMQMMHYSNILLGSLVSGMTFLLLYILSRRMILSFFVGILIALDPGIFLFEAYILYDLLTLFLLIASTTAIACYSRTLNSRYLFLFIGLLSMLTLTRSVYHILIVVVGFLLTILIVKKEKIRVLSVCLLICLLPFGWYAKNYYLFDFFGASSWQGFALWKVASNRYSPEQLNKLYEVGIIEPVAAEVEILRPASHYQPYGFNIVSEVPVLNQNDRHNINMIEVAKAYQRSAINLIYYEPLNYLKSVWSSYLIFNIPSAQFKHHINNIEKIPLHARLASEFIQGRFLEHYLHYSIGSIYFFLIPLTLLIYLSKFVYEVVIKKGRFVLFFQNHILQTWILFLIFYTTFVSITFEVGENNREKFYIEQLINIYIISAVIKFLVPIFTYLKNVKLHENRLPTTSERRNS